MPSNAKAVKSKTGKSKKAKAAEIAPPASQPIYGAEIEPFHSRLLRVSLALEESRAYWEQREESLRTAKLPMANSAKAKLAEQAFESRWFGNKSLERVRRLLADFSYRYDSYPATLSVLTRWQPSDPITRQNICHWHLQLADPMYRDFSGHFLEQRRLDSAANTTSIDRDIVARWVSQNLPTEWATTTVLRMATALITCATAAGLCEHSSGARVLTYPKVTDAALAYWLYFLKDLRFTGTLLANPYFSSVGLSEGFLEPRLRQLSGLTFSRMGDLHEFNWQYANLERWAEGELGIGETLAVQPEAIA